MQVTLHGDSRASLTETLPAALTSAYRWNLDYDLCVCHSAKDDREAEHLVSYLEATVRSLRCFLPPRDCPLGSPVSTELCRALQNSHCWVFLMTSNFIQDEWCLYQMHQALSEAPMSNRIIPTVLHLPFSNCPKELRFYYIIDLSQKASGNSGYEKVYKAVLKYLEDALEKDDKSTTPTTPMSENKDNFTSSKGTNANDLYNSNTVQQRSPQSRKACNIM